MKKHLLLCLYTMLCVLAGAQNVMVVEKNDNSTSKFKLDDVRRVYFENDDNNPNINPSNSALYPRLKDKDGNPVLLTSRSVSSTWGYVYTNDGRLTIFGELEPTQSSIEEHFVVDGLTFRADMIDESEGSIMGTLELNQDGLITKAVIAMTGLYKNGIVGLKGLLNYSFLYNAECQLLQIDEEESLERYDENGNLEESASGHGIQTRTWENGNLIKVEFTQDSGNLDLTDRSSSQPKTYSYSREQNITRQPLQAQYHLLSDFGINHLYALGLFGVGPKNFPSSMTATLNENGTINTLNGKQYTYVEP